MTKEKDLNYVIDIYVNRERIDYFPPMGHDFNDRLGHIKEWANDKGLKKYDIVIKRLDYWFICKYNPNTDKFDEKAKIYLVQINSFDEIVRRFSTERIHFHGKLARKSITGE